MDRINEIATQLHELTAELLSILGGTGNVEATYPDVFDLQPLGYTQLGSVENFRDELNKSEDPLAKRFAASLPRYWFVQDQEDYVNLTANQQNLQEANCSTARFYISLMGSSASDDVLWRTWQPAVTTAYKPEAGGFVRTPIIAPDGSTVYAVANDARTFNGEVTKANPRVKDMGGVVRAAYAYFYERNRNATHNVDEIKPTGG